MGGGRSGPSALRKRADARRNEGALLDAAAAAFIAAGVDAPVRDIAAKAGVGVSTIYRHVPTRADLIIAVYRRQIEACAEAGPAPVINKGRLVWAEAGRAGRTRPDAERSGGACIWRAGVPQVLTSG